MSSLRILEQPELRSPVLIAAFAGWSDAGGAATSASQYLIDRWHAERVAEIDSEEYFDFTQLRPTVKYVADVRQIEWPENAFYYHQTPERDFLVLNGIEPHLKWKAYVQDFLEVINTFKVSMVVSLGAMFVEYPHTRPLRITGQVTDPDMQKRAGIVTRGGRYEGPTGINGVLNATLRELDIPASTIWANVPHYVSAAPNPPATLALLRSLTSMLELEVPLGRMVRASAAFDAQLNEATAKNTEVLEYVRTLEERVDAEANAPELPAELPATESIMKDIEDFLRQSSKEEE
jgi:proteasome assembly chaperone (PAC2) family protein